MADVLNEYLGGLNEDLIKDNFVIVYEVLTVAKVVFCVLPLSICCLDVKLLCYCSFWMR